jgi:hypothetical protein
MKITRDDLGWAAGQGILQPGQDEALWRALEHRYAHRPRFDVVHVAYYAGVLIVIGAMSWFMTLAWEALPGLALTAVAAGYAAAFVFVARWLWDRLNLQVPAGLLLTAAVCMVPLGLYGFLRHFDLWPGAG